MLAFRRALCDRLDVVHPGRHDPGAVLRWMARGARSACGPGRTPRAASLAHDQPGRRCCACRARGRRAALGLGGAGSRCALPTPPPRPLRRPARATWRQALSDARDAVSRDPLALAPRFELSAIYCAIGDKSQARAALVNATRVQPDNSDSWLQLGSYDLQQREPRLALVVAPEDRRAERQLGAGGPSDRASKRRPRGASDKQLRIAAAGGRRKSRAGGTGASGAGRTGASGAGGHFPPRPARSAHGSGDQQPPQHWRPGDGVDGDPVEPEIAQDTLERPPRVQVEVIPERLREPLDPAKQHAQPTVRGRRHSRTARPA